MSYWENDEALERLIADLYLEAGDELRVYEKGLSLWTVILRVLVLLALIGAIGWMCLYPKQVFDLFNWIGKNF